MRQNYDNFNSGVNYCLMSYMQGRKKYLNAIKRQLYHRYKCFLHRLEGKSKYQLLSLTDIEEDIQDMYTFTKGSIPSGL